jgi:signal transduction histidine kinase
VKKIWTKLSLFGTAKVTDPLELQSLMLTNRISLIAVVLMLIIGILLGQSQWNGESYLVLMLSPVFLVILLLMHFNQQNFARLLLCFMIPVLVVGMSVFSKKIPGELVTDTEYFDYRYVLLATGLIPVMLFTTSQWRLLATSLLFYLFAFVAFDSIHNFFQVGYYQIDHSVSSYFISSWIATLIFSVIVVGVLILRSTSNEIQSRNLELIDQLNHLNKEFDSRNFELHKAHKLVEQRSRELKQANDQLKDRVAQATTQLQLANTELVKQNSELQQFSYTISHNLRGPVASLLGIINLIKVSEPELAKNQLIEHLTRSTKSLDSTIRDLSLIIDIRNDIYRIKQKINVGKLLEEVMVPFQREIEDRAIQIKYNLTTYFFYSIRPTLSSIFYNLISNALKYLSPKRPGVIEITSNETEYSFNFSVRDNGLGIDLERQGDNVFKLYKRFHAHTEGKGVGLYLVKMQTEILGGTISVTSEPDSYTEFNVTLPKTTDVQHQLLLNEPYAEIYFDANRNLMGIDWFKDVNSELYRKVLLRALDFMREHTALHWLLDISKRGTVSPEDQMWMLEHVLPTVFKLGLKRVAVVYQKQLSSLTLQFYNKNIEVFKKHDIEIFFTQAIGEAEAWLTNRQVLNGTITYVGQRTTALAE